jgi:hypothetical protein
LPPGIQALPEHMPGSFPTDAHAGKGQTGAFAADVNTVNLAQVVLQEASRPNGVPIAMNPKVGVDELLQQRIDNAKGCRRSPCSGSVLQARADVLTGAWVKAQQPVVNGLSADERALRYFFYSVARIEPQQRKRSG